MSGKTRLERAARRALLSSSAVALVLVQSLQPAQAQGEAFDVSFSGTGISGNAIVLTTGTGTGYQTAVYITGSIADTNVDANTYAITGLSNYRIPDQQIQAPGTPYFDNSGMAFSSNGPHDNNYILAFLSNQYVIGHSVGGVDEAYFGATETAAVHPSVDTAQPFYDETSTPLAQSTAVFTGGTFKPTGTYSLGAPVLLDSQGGTIDSTNGFVYLTNAIAGPGGLTATGTGNSTILSGTNSYSGGTTINSGAVLAIDTTINALPGNVLDNGWLQITNVGNATYAGVISGSGNLQNFQVGKTLTLTADNTATGVLDNYPGAALQLGAGGTSGTWAGDIDNGGSLVFDRSDTVTYGGTISDFLGSGSLTQAGSGTLTLTGENTYTGGTTINSGSTLQLGNGGTSGSVAGNILDNGHLAFDRSDTIAYSGTISGTGDLTIGGTGTVAISGFETFAGTTTVNSGATLQLGDGAGNAGLLAGAITDNGLIVFNAGVGTFVNYVTGITGTGGATVASGTLELTGVNTFGGTTTIDSGATLQLGDGAGTMGLLAGAITDNGTLVFNGGSGTNTIFFTGITGSGAATFESGTVELDGDNTYTGLTTVDNGATLKLGGSGSIASSGDPLVNGTFDISGASGDVSVVSLSGSGTVILGANTLILTNASDTFSGEIDGTGGLTIAGGTEALSGVGTFSGTTTIDPGATLQLGAGTGVVGLLAGAITDNGTLVFNGGSGSLAIYATGITGSGAVTVASGTMELEGDNTYTGLTTVDNGATLDLIGSGSIAQSGDPLVNGTFDISGASGGVPVISLSGSGTVILGANTLTLTNASDTFSGEIDGTGGLTIAGGTETLTGIGTFSGTTTVDLGATLQLGDGANHMGLLAGAITDNGTLVFNGGSGNLTIYATGITGSGAVTVESGSLTLEGDNTYTGLTTVDNGATLKLFGSGSIAQSGDPLVNGTFDISGASGGVPVISLSGSGTVILGANTLTLTNASDTFSGGIQGAGGLTIAGGIETLTGANTYTGATTINSGAELKLGSTGSIATSSGVTDNGTFDISAETTGVSVTSLSGAGTLALGANTLTLTNASGIFGGGSSGTGGLTIAAGTETISALNSYTGTTTINSGATLQLGDGAGHMGLLSGAIADNGSLVFNGGSGSLTNFANGISGSGAVTLASGTLQLSGTNTYSGSTFVLSGTLAAGAASAFSPNSLLAPTAPAIIALNGFNQAVAGIDGSGTITLGSATLTTNPTAADNFVGVISGSGSLTKGGTGTQTLGGANTYTGATTINAGTLQMGVANALSAATDVTVASGATFNLNNFNQTIGSLSGAGNVALGSATLSTNEDNATTTFSGVISGTGGLTKVGTGTLFLTGASTYSGATLINGGVLDVNGSIANSAVTVNPTGILKGNGTVGGISAGGGATVAPGNSIGTLHVAGNVAFGAGSVYQVEVNAAGQSDLIVAGGSATLTGGIVQVLPQAGSYAVTTVYPILTAAGGVTGIFSGVTSPVAVLIPTLSYKPNEVDLTLTSIGSLGTTPNQKAVAGALQAGGSGALLNAIVALPLAQIPAALDASSGEIHASMRSLLLETGETQRQIVLDRLHDAQHESGTGMWGRLFGSWGAIGSDGTAATLNTNYSGLTVGVDTPVGDGFLVGGDAGYGLLQGFVGQGRGSSLLSDSYHAAVYAGFADGPFSLKGSANGSWGTIRTDRSVRFQGFSDRDTARQDGRMTQLFAEATWDCPLNGFDIEPFLNGGWLEASTGAFSETGGAAALSGARGTSDETFLTLGTRLSTDVTLANGGTITPNATLGWLHGFRALTPSRILNFEATGAGFTVFGVPLDEDEAIVDLSISSHPMPGLTASVGYDGILSGHVRDNGLHAYLSWNF